MRISQHWVRRWVGPAAVALALTACQSGDKQTAAGGDTSAGGRAVAVSGAGDAGSTVAGSQYQNVQPVAMRTFSGDKQAAVDGRQAFIKYNCYGCHGGLAGGAMGPSLRDDEWKFGGTDEQILATLHQGRPAGMPAWKGVIPDAELQKIIVYIHSMRSPDEPTFFFAVGDTTTKTARAYR